MADENVNIVFTAVDNASSALNSIKKSFTEFQSKLRTAEQIIRMVAKAVDETVGTYVRYADQVRTLTQLTNQSTEKMSRLIQVSDDYKLTVDDLTTASKKLATQGFSLNVETIAKLSDQYLKLNTGSERQLFLTENLGRAGKEWTEMLSQGSAAILAKNSAVSAGLILDEKALVQARQYEIAVDTLKDTWMAYKVGVGQAITPGVVQGLEEANLRARALALGIDAATIRWASFADIVGMVTDAERTLAIEQAKVDPASYLGPSWDAATAAAYTYNEQLYGTIGTMEEVAVSALKMDLALDGSFSADDAAKVAAYELSLGLISEAEYNAMMKAIDLQAAIEALHDRNITVTTSWLDYYTGNTDARRNLGTTRFARGGPLPLGRGWAEVGEQGSEGITPSGVVVPHQAWERMKRSGLVPGKHYLGGGILDRYREGTKPEITDESVRMHSGGAGSYVPYSTDPNAPSNWGPQGPQILPTNNGSSGGSSAVVQAVTASAAASSAAVATTTAATQSVASAAATISASGEKTAQATMQGNQQQIAGNASVVARLQSIENLLAQNFQRMPKDWAAAQARSVSA
jgi:hypothetical protein